MYLNFASKCYLKVVNYPQQWDVFVKRSNWQYHCVATAQQVDIHVEFMPQIPFKTQKIVHPKYGSADANFIIYDDKKRKVAFDLSKVGFEPSTIWIEHGFDLNFFEDILFDLIKIVLLGKNVACIHASSYLTQNGAKIIAGWEGIGKSSIMLKKVYQGGHFLSDDRAFVSNEGFVFPIYSYVKQYSSEFASFKELFEHSSFKEKFIIKLNVFLHSVKDKSNSSKIHYGIQKILNLLRRLNLYEIHIPLEKIAIGENKGYRLEDVFILQQISFEKMTFEEIETEDVISILLNTTKFDDNNMFKIYQVYKYLFPKRQNAILEHFDNKFKTVLHQGFGNTKIKFAEVLLSASITEIVEKIQA